jgi:hypothetical protein
VGSRAELFRGGLPAHRLRDWKEVLLTGRHLPSWIRDIQDRDGQRATIEGLTSEHVFRSQSRAERDAPKSRVEIIDWGLQHIDRLRKASVEARDQRLRQRTNFLIPLFSVLIALAAVMSGAYIQIANNNSQAQLKRYEVTFKTKQELYGSLMRKLSDTFFSAHKDDQTIFLRNLDELQGAFYSLEPFLNDDDRQQIDANIQLFSNLCLKTYDHVRNATPPAIGVGDLDSFLSIKEKIRQILYSALFRRGML